MIPIRQTRVGRSGNCISACLASILELPLQTVPDFIDEGEGFFDAINEWLGRKGLVYRQLWLDTDEGAIAPVGWHTIEGVSPRGRQHAVVARDGRAVFDPHPEDGTARGLRTPQRYGVLEPRAVGRDAFFGPASPQYACRHCGKNLHDTKAGWIAANGARTCFQAPDKKHEPTSAPYQGRVRDQRPGEEIRLPNGKRATVAKVTPARNLFGEEELHVKTTTGEVLPIPIKKGK